MNCPAIRLRTVASEDGAAILDTHSGQITALNSTGAYVWQRLEEGKNADEIALLLAAETGENLSIVARGVSEFLNQLEENHLRSH